MLDVIQHKTNTPDEVFLEIIMKPSNLAHLSIARRIFIVIAVVCISLGIAFWAIGAGPVLPFVGIEVVLLYAAYRFGVNHGRKSETLSLSENDLIIRKAGFGKKLEAIRLQPYWSHLDLAENPGQHLRLSLRSKGYYIEIGSLLAPDERQLLAETLGSELQKLKGAT
tara:strand:- start:15633 stop:16133 length:501 start_codon:yes stop_codon:yes gene_type:complete